MLLFIFFLKQPSIWSLLERSSGKTPKISNLRGKVLLLIFLGGSGYIRFNCSGKAPKIPNLRGKVLLLISVEEVAI
uniref:Uncharacterized protein n=1 Tax=Setaria viridis TaxID=4556 RepID=A0A4U6UYC2_SETVI|nr:hypothetical protein SEVIR_4G196300v2 [Setaria viridis]